MLIAPHDITGVLLCGGEGRRMGAAEKPLALLHGRPLLAHVLDRLAPQVGRVIISANRELATYATFGHEVISDAVPGLGPLGGIAGVIAHVSTPWLFCCPGDAPLLQATLVHRLAGSITEANDAALPHDGVRAQHLFLLVRTAACHTLDAYLASGQRSVHGWLTALNVKAVPMPELARSFDNVNTPEDLARLETQRPLDTRGSTD